jgi:hypothetical protein
MTKSDGSAVLAATPRRRRADRTARSTAVPPRKPMAMTKRVSLFARDIQVRLAPAAMDILMDGARVLSEGDISGKRYAGSTMVTIELLRSTLRVSDPPSAETAKRVATLHASDDRARARAKRLATSEARRVAKCTLGPHQIDVAASAIGPQIHLSINVEADRMEGSGK